MLDVVECLDGGVRVGGGVEDVDSGGEHFAACAVRRVLVELSEQAYFTLKSVTVRTLVGQD